MPGKLLDLEIQSPARVDAPLTVPKKMGRPVQFDFIELYEFPVHGA